MKTVLNNSSVTVECCECGLRHLWTFKIKRGKTVEDDFIEVETYRLGTKQPTKAVEAKPERS